MVKSRADRLSSTGSAIRNSYTLDGNLVSGHVGPLVGSFDPDLGTFNFPLWAGKKWSKDWLLKTDAGRIWGNTHGEALDWEQVTVPAGTLNALKLKIEYRTGLSNVQMNCWYAPEVNALAKCDTTDPDFKSQELISNCSGKRRHLAINAAGILCYVVMHETGSGNGPAR